MTKYALAAAVSPHCIAFLWAGGTLTRDVESDFGRKLLGGSAFGATRFGGPA